MKLDIPEIDQIPDFVKILDDLSVGNNPYLVGAAGTGKTTLGQKIAYAKKGRKENDGNAPPFITLQCSQWTSPIDIIGGQTMDGYKEGRLVDAWRDGKLLILDEMPKLDANTAGLLNEALAKTADQQAVIFNGMGNPIPKHKDFGCIATGNTTGKGFSGNYVGNNKQDSSLLDRFSSCYYHIGFNTALEKQLIYPVLFDICDKIRRAILKYEGKADGDEDTEDIMTLRTMLNLQRIYELEMRRITDLPDRQGNKVMDIRNGKTLKDGLESFFTVMGAEKARNIKLEVDVDSFYRSYRGMPYTDDFVKEYERKAV